ncbi:MAG: pseudouridine synthase [Candidatus Celaenobacter antarcticus]|nr:pseudouridine synthase [Candidatus Celaenobacter antarcticus]
MRINKFLAHAGLGSRRSCEQLVLESKIRVNGKIIRDLATDIDSQNDIVEYKNKKLRLSSNKIYLMLNKPVGYLVTAADPFERQTVFDLLPKFKEHIFPIGRLDKNSEGLLLLSNDGDFAQKITHPSKKLPKTYLVKAKGRIYFRQLRDLREGVQLEDGKTLPAKVFIKSFNKAQNMTKLRMIIYEGRNRQIRRMLKAVGSSVIELKRVQIGEINIGKMPKGEWRYLKEKEVRSITKERS